VCDSLQTFNMFTDENLPIQKLELSHRPTKRLKFSHPRGVLSLAGSPEPLSERRAPKRPANFPVPKPVKKRCLSSTLFASAESRLNSLDDHYRVQIGLSKKSNKNRRHCGNLPLSRSRSRSNTQIRLEEEEEEDYNCEVDINSLRKNVYHDSILCSYNMKDEKIVNINVLDNFVIFATDRGIYRWNLFDNPKLELPMSIRNFSIHHRGRYAFWSTRSNIYLWDMEEQQLVWENALIKHTSMCWLEDEIYLLTDTGGILFTKILSKKFSTKSFFPNAKQLISTRDYLAILREQNLQIHGPEGFSQRFNEKVRMFCWSDCHNHFFAAQLQNRDVLLCDLEYEVVKAFTFDIVSCAWTKTFFIAASKRHVVFHSFDIENQIFQQQRVVMFTHGKIEKVIAVEGKIVLLYDVNKLCVLKEEKQNITKRSVSTFSPFKDSFCTIR